MQNYIGKNCPYCQFPFKPRVSVVFCSSCDVPHHRECWQENGKCTTYGCNGQPTTSLSASASSSTITTPLPPSKPMQDDGDGCSTIIGIIFLGIVIIAGIIALLPLLIPVAVIAIIILVLIGLFSEPPEKK